VAPTLAGHVVRPWRLAGPMISILRSRSSRYALDELAHREMPVFAIHGSHDLPVPLRTAREAVERTNGTLVTVEKAGHSWILRDPETLPAIVAELMDGELGEACTEALAARGVRGAKPSATKIEAACCSPGARIRALTPHGDRTMVTGRHGRPRYRWVVEDHTERAAS
jgi:hypothetical protein